nr:CHAT domain-containing protein [Okeania sp. SIO1I7]
MPLLAVLTATPVKSQPITPANDGTGTIVTPQGDQFNIEGGTHNGANLFHSFDQFNVNSGQTANFLTTPDTQNILGRVTGGNASIINGLIQVTGGNSNLFLMNPAGIMFGPNASLNIPASFSVTTATGIGFDNNNFWFQTMGTNEYSNLVGNPSGYRFDVSNPGAIVNEGNLNSGENLTLLGGTVINTGELSTTNGNITIAAVEGGSVLRISQPEHLLSLEVETLHATSLQNGEDISNLSTLSLPELLTGGEETNATSIVVNNNGELELTDNTIIADTPGNVFVSGNIDLSTQNSESNFIVLANNDITVNNLIETAGFVEFKAGGSIQINGDINTSVGNSNIDIFGNNDEMNIANRSDGKASINQLDGTTLNAGSGTINIELGNLGEVGDINLASLTTTGEVLVNANGGNITRVSDNSLINAGSILFQTSGSGGIGLIDAPLRLDVDSLEAVSGSGGVFFDVGNVNIGGVSEEVDGIVTAGGDIDIKSEGNVTLTETISTIETVENNSETEISPPSQAGLGGIEAVEATENTAGETSGSINIEATGDIVATGSGIKGGGESVSLFATNITINDEFEETSGDADVKLEATNDITVEDIEDDVLEFMSGGGEIEFRADVDGDGVGVVEMLDNEADVGSNPGTFENGADTIKTNGRNLTIAGAGIVLGNIDTSSAPPVFSGGELLATIDVDEGGAIPPEGTEGTGTFTFTVDGDLGTVENLDIRFSAEHTWDGDLEVYLKSPQEQEVTLFTGVGGSGQNFQDTVLDDDASRSINSGVAPFDGTYRSQGSLAEFNGENPHGTWTLRVEDSLYGDSGTLFRAGDTAPWGTATGTQLLLRNPTALVSGGGNGGAINLEATHSDISVRNIRSFSEIGNGGIIDLKANNNIITGLINSSAIEGKGIGGDVNLNSISGNIDIFSLDTSSFDGDGGNVEIKAAGDITTAEITTDSGELIFNEEYGYIERTSGGSGNAGQISIESTRGSIDTTAGSLFARSVSGNGGNITISAMSGDITTQSLNSSSSSYFYSSSDEVNLGNGGDITISAMSGDITTQSLNSSSSSYFYSSLDEGNSGNGGDITISAMSGDITTQSLNSSSYSYVYSSSDEGNSGNGGNITISAMSGDITTQSLNSSSGIGNGGNINISSEGDLSTGRVYSSSYGWAENSGNGGDITISAMSGDITTQSLNSSSYSYVYSSSDEGNSGNGGDITLDAGGSITTESLNSTSRAGNGGDITISAKGDIDTRQVSSYSYAFFGNSGNGGNITISTEGDITTESLYSFSWTDNGNSGSGGRISLNANTIKFNPPDLLEDEYISQFLTNKLQIITFSFGTNSSAEGGEVNITTKNLSNAEIFTLSTHSNSGKVTIESQPQGNLEINDLSIITSIQETIENPVTKQPTQTRDKRENDSNPNKDKIDINIQGKSGPVSIISNGNLNLKNVTIESDTKTHEPAGDVDISSLGNITLNNTDILSTTNGQGNAGTITLETSQDILLTNSSQLQASTQGRENAGNAGTINIQANNLNLDQDTSLITETTGAGNPGSITIEANTVDIGEGAQISATVVIGSTSDGDGGNITINTNELNITGKLGIFAETEASANAGILTLSPYKDNPDLDITFSNDGFISASTSSTGNGGNIFISAPENIDISGEGFIAVETSGTGNAGIIDIQTENLRISNGVAISASTEDKGNAGQININTTNFTLDKGTSLTTETNSKGKAGDIEITTEKLTIGENAQISATARVGASNTEAGGNITINANDLLISGKLGIFAETAGESPAGTLTLKPYKTDPNLNIEFKEKGFISARTTSIGDGGNINIFAPENINIKGEGKISVETTGKGNAGTIDIQTENLNLSEQVAISAETNSAGKAGDININSQTVTIGKGTEISATAGEKATNNEGGGNITINTNDLLISGKLGIFAETEGKAKAGTLTLNPYSEVGEQGSRGVGEARRVGDAETRRHGEGVIGKIDPDLNITFTENGFISARTTSSGDGGNINIFAPENINISGEGRITVETEGSGNAGTIDIQTENLTIAENTKISAATSDSGDGGRININPTQTFQLEGQILTETTGTGNGGTITINTGEMIAPNSTISAKSTYAGNAGTIEITAQENITTGIIQSSASESQETADGGEITITSQQGEINATQPIQSFSEKGNAGDVTLSAKTDVTTNTISSHGEQQGGKITIITETGNIDTSNGFMANYSGEGTGGNVTLEASAGNITTGDIYSFADADGGQILLKAGGDINITENSNIISASEPPEEETRRGGDTETRRGGDIILEAGNNINTTTARIYSGADIGDTGKIDIIADGAIETGQIDLASGFVRDRVTVNENFTLIPLPQGEATQGKAGNITLNSNNGTIDTTGGTINSRSPDGSGDITLNARENITTGKLEASALNESKPTTGGDVNITSEQGEINATQAIETFSQKGTAGNVNITAEGHIHTETILSQGMEQGGHITINSYSENSIDAAGALNTYSDEGIAGDVTLTSPGSINISSIRSEGIEQGGNITVNSEKGEIYSTGNIDSYSDKGKGGNVEVNAPKSVTLANVSSFGMTESGDLKIQSSQAQVNTGDVTTQAPAGSSGSIFINGTEVGTGDLRSIGTTSAGEINVEAIDGSITTYDITMSSDGTIGNLTLRATEDINTEDINQNAGEGDVNSNIIAGEDQTTGDINQIAENDTNNVQIADGNLTTGDITQTAGNDTNNIQIADGNQNIGDVTQTAGNDTNNIQIADGNQNIGDVTQTAGNDTNNIQIADGNQNIGDVTQTAGNDTNNIQIADGNQNIGDVTQTAGNDTNNIQTAEGNQNIGDVTQTFGNESINIQTQEINQNISNVTQAAENYTNNIQLTEGNQNIDDVTQNFGNESINIQTQEINQNTDNTSVIPDNNNSITNLPFNQENSQTNNNANLLNNSPNNTTRNSVEINTSTLTPTITPSNNNQTTNTATAKEQTEESIKNTTDTQKILKRIDTFNTNPLTVATGSNQVITILEQGRTKEYSNYFGTDFNEQLLHTKNVRDVLTDMANQTGKESAVVYINAYPEQLQIILYTKSGEPIIKTIAEANRQKLMEVVLELRAHITSPQRRYTDSYLPSAQQLYDWFIAPISAELKAANIETLLFSMDEGLRTLPVAALHDGKQFLIEKYSLSLIPSVSLMDTNYHPLQDTQVLAMGASEFVEQNPLPAVPVELENIAQQLWQGDMFLNEDFTLDNLVIQRESYPYPIVHLATHANFRPGKASNSYIQFWGTEKIKLDEMRKLGWNEPAVELLVLSACRTAIGDRNAELGFAGLAVAAGVKSALASVWYVNDEGTLGLMTEFYTHLSDTKIKAEALRQAQLAMLRGKVVIAEGELRGSGTRGVVTLPPVLENIENYNLSHPYYWAGFTMVGSPW